MDIGFKQAIDQGLYPGPRLMVSVNIISPTGGLADRASGSGHRNAFRGDPRVPEGVADGPDAVRAKVREIAMAGADVIKFATTGGASSRPGHGPMDIEFGPDEVRALVEEARALGRRTHVPRRGRPRTGYGGQRGRRVHRARVLPGGRP